MTGLLAMSGAQETFLPNKFPKEIKVSDSWKDVCYALKNRILLLDKIKNKVKSLLSRFTKAGEATN
jgi:hypothetical protein